MTAAWCEASLDPSCCCKVQHSRREMGEAAEQRSSSPSTQVTFICIWNYPPESAYALLVHSNAPAAVTGITQDLFVQN